MKFLLPKYLLCLSLFSILLPIQNCYASAAASASAAAAEAEAEDDENRSSVRALIQKADEKASSVYQSINKNWRYPEGSEEMTPSKSSKIISTTVAEGQVSALVWDSESEPDLSAALEEIVSAKLVTECANAARIARLSVLSHLLGKEKMDDLIDKVKRRLEDSKTYTEYNFMAELSWSFCKKTTDLSGDGMYPYAFVNHPSYRTYKPTGDAANYNVIRLSTGQYFSFNPEFFTEPKSYEELEAHLLTMFTNDEFVDGATKRQHKIYCKRLNPGRFKTERLKHQEKVGYSKFDFNAISRFIETGEL